MKKFFIITLLFFMCLKFPAFAQLTRDIYQPHINAAIVSKFEEARKIRKNQRNKINIAIKSLEAIVKESPEYFMARYNLGLAYMEINNKKRGFAELEKAKLLKEKYNIREATIYNTLGYYYLEDAEYVKAKKNFLKALESNNFRLLGRESKGKVNNNLGIVYLYQLDFKEAKKCFEDAIKFGNDDARKNLAQMK